MAAYIVVKKDPVAADDTVCLPLADQLKTFLTARESVGFPNSPGQPEDFATIKVSWFLSLFTFSTCATNLREMATDPGSRSFV